uniref:Beta-1,4-glucuronyltransferase 1 n=1 Tax=Parastrongyloides trichosuri TaxID=131310 RepID=A0A0N4Z763_PARTI
MNTKVLFIFLYLIKFLYCYKKIKFDNYKNKACVSYHYWRCRMNLGENSTRITLVLHSTMDYITYLEKQVDVWEGPISVALVIPKPNRTKCIHNKKNKCSSYDKKNMEIFSVLNYFKKLFNTVKISLHLIYDIDKYKDCPPMVIIEEKISINGDSLMNLYRKRLESIKKLSIGFDIYPINIARNIGRLGKLTRLFLSGDIENYSSNNYETKVSKLATKYLLEQKRKVVLVHRRFEYEYGYDRPTTKEELKKLYNMKKAGVFHAKFYLNAHFIIGIKDWLKTPENVDKVSIFRTLNYTSSYWEPQFVGDDRVPFHDERFPYRFKSNIHLGSLLCNLEFRFSILNDVFTVHEGRKKNLSDSDLLTINKGKKRYGKIISQFNAELSTKYPHMKDKCPHLYKF